MSEKAKDANITVTLQSALAKQVELLAKCAIKHRNSPKKLELITNALVKLKYCHYETY